MAKMLGGKCWKVVIIVPIAWWKVVAPVSNSVVESGGTSFQQRGGKWWHQFPTAWWKVVAPVSNSPGASGGGTLLAHKRQPQFGRNGRANRGSGGHDWFREIKSVWRFASSAPQVRSETRPQPGHRFGGRFWPIQGIRLILTISF